MRSPIQKLDARARTLWLALRSERASPRDTFWSVFIGAHLGCSPALFVRPVIAVLLATALRKNRLWAFVAAHVSGNWLVNPFIVFVAVQLSHRVRTGAWLALTFRQFRETGFGLILDWAIGWLPVGTVVGAIVGAGGYVLARRAAAAEQRPKAVRA